MKIARTLIALTLVSTVRSFTLGSRAALSTSVARATAPTTSRTLGIRMMSASPMDFAKTEIANNKIVVFSKSFCPFCKKTKSLLTQKGVDFTVYELNQMDDGGDIQDALLEISGQKTVPNVFINGEHIGGNSDMQDADASGKLDELLAGAK